MGSLKNDLSCYLELKETSKDCDNSFYRVCEKIPIGVAAVDCKGNCLKVNSKLCNILGYPESELLGTGFSEFINFKELRIDLWVTDKNSQGSLKLQTREKHYLRKDGTDVWIGISPFLVIDPENRPTFVFFQIEDITGQKKADASFKTSETCFDLIYGNISEGITINEQVGKFIEVNPAICKKLGYRKDELLLKTASELITLESSKIFAEKVKELYKIGRARVQVKGVCKDGTLLPVELSMWLIEYKGKQAVFSIVSDIKE
ncbi:hypothetical protein SDC9_85462 [bioreactor metagenome]|uniref:PAS domain-containing protein n=1 Tax=bioreactor metagenome TaxID=1076179 RepID=A0A644ZD87_9ZZZZ